MTELSRRHVLSLAGSLVIGLRPVIVHAFPADTERALAAVLQGAVPLRERVQLDLPPLVENGNSVPMTVNVDSPMTDDDFISDIYVFNQRNPQPDITHLQLSPVNGLARISTRIKLAATQTITALARHNDGRFFMAQADVIVTLAACIEDLR
jgi:sulfur-oxidizing protein SoxY